MPSFTSSHRFPSFTSFTSITEDDINDIINNESSLEPQQDCPICLDPLHPSDILHPIPCPNSCCFNFCLECARSLLQSSRDDYQMASDGNKHVKVRLACPQCRGSLENVLGDMMRRREKEVARGMKDVEDCVLSAMELRKKYAFDNSWGSDSFGASSLRSFGSFGRLSSFDDVRQSPMERRNKKRVQRAILSTYDPNGEEGFEVDEHEESVKRLLIDRSLFGGLEHCMSNSEQRYVTGLMTGGEKEKLAIAARTLFNISDLSLRGGVKVRSSIFGDDGGDMKKARRGLLSDTGGGGGGMIKLTRSRSFAVRLREAELEQMRRLAPLPVRMPKFVDINYFDPESRNPTLVLVDDEWDGSIADAFERTTGSGRKLGGGFVSMILKKKMEQDERNFFNGTELDDTRTVLVSGGGSRHETHVDGPKNRILVQHVSGDAGHMGIVKGDIITHVNGEEFLGNARDLNRFIASHWNSNSDEEDKLSIVVNADACVAEALKLRALMC